LRKHGIRFEIACCVFDDPYRDAILDDREYDEDRWTIVGRAGPLLLVVAYTYRKDRWRIISARKAKPQEEQAYYDRRAGSR
jgi:uncharacterized DUF497 family protein